MKRLRRAWRRLAGAFAGSRRERELAEELASHLEMQTEDNLRLGMSPEEARRAAALKFGGLESVKESYRDQRGPPPLETLLQDVRYALRGMRRNPAFSAVAALSLALGIAGATAVFSVMNATLLRRLPYPEPDRLATVSLGGAIPAPAFETFRRQARSIEQAALFRDLSVNLAGQGQPERISGVRASASLFSLLGIHPQIGRTFTELEDAGRQPVVVLSDSLWRNRFAADPRVLGRKLLLNGVPQTVIGVMPPGFQFPEGPELPDTSGPFPAAQIWRPMALADWERTCNGCYNFAMIARLRRGVSAAEARRELASILKRLAPGDAGTVTVRTLDDTLTAGNRVAVSILFGAVAVALLIACLNVANLLVARGLERQAEIALRRSIGAGRARIVRQLLTEALVLALCSAVLALPMAALAIRALVATAPFGVPGLDQAALDARVLAFALALALLTATLFGAAPAWATARRDPGEVLKGGRRTASRPGSRLRPALIIAEFALSLVLLVSAILLVRSFVTVARTPLGFHAENVLTLRLLLPDTRYDDARRAALIDQLVERCQALPGVLSSAAVSTLPLTGESEGWGLAAQDRPDAWTTVRVRAITPRYFRTLGIRLRAGREFDRNDRGANPVAILSAGAARRLWGTLDPVGRKTAGKRPMTVVGVVDDTRASGLDNEVQPYLYLPFWQFSPDELALAVLSAADPNALLAAVKAEIRRLDKDQPVSHVAVLRQLVADSIAPRRYQAVLMALFAAFALALAAIGIYGVVSYSVAQRTHEIGIRMALGASRADVLGGVFRQAAGLAAAGSALGVAAALALTPLLRSLLYGIRAAEPLVFAAAALLLLSLAALAALLPARRAVRLEPMACLRYE